MKKPLAFILVLASFSANAREAYDCDGVGFTIEGKRATFGPVEWASCSTEGNWIYFATPEDCKNRYTRYFDKITYILQAVERKPIGDNSVPDKNIGPPVRCKKIK